MTTTTVGERIRVARRASPGCSQRLLAERVGCHRVHIARIETGTRHPSRKLMAMIADALGVPLSEIDGARP